MKNKYNEKFMKGMDKDERKTLSSLSHRLANDEQMTSLEVKRALNEIKDSVNSIIK